jgi:hypothetical protein
VAGLILGMSGFTLLAFALEARKKGAGTTALRKAQVQATADYVRRHTPVDGTVFLWAHAADVYFLAERRPASRFIYPQPLLTPGYANAAVVERFIDELRVAAPTLIVDGSGNQFDGEELTPTLGRWDPEWRFPPAGSSARVGRAWWSMTPALASFYRWVAANYVPVDTVGPTRWVVHRRRAQAAAGTR